MAEQLFRCRHRVSYAECTMGNHVYYSRYLDLLEKARSEFLRRLGKSMLEWQEEDTIFPVLECRIRYHAPARYDDWVTIELGVKEARGARLSFAHRILAADGRLLVEAETSHACASISEKPKRLPEELLTALQPWVETPAGDESAES